MDEKIKFSYSLDGERYHGTKNNTFDECVREALQEVKPRGQIWVGVQRAPTQPEYYWDADDWLEHVSCQDDYAGELAEDWDTSSKQERESLEEEVRPILAAWLDRCGVRPRFWIVENPVVLVELNGDAVPEDGEENVRLFTEYRKTVIDKQLETVGNLLVLYDWRVKKDGDRVHLANNQNWRMRILEDLYTAIDPFDDGPEKLTPAQLQERAETKAIIDRLAMRLVGGVPSGPISG